MSHDVYFEIDTGGDEPACVGGELNHTSNCGLMFDTAMVGGIRGLHGRTGAAVQSRLQMALKKMEASPAQYRQMNPGNGWGDSLSAYIFLQHILENAERHPKAIISVSA